MTNILRVTEAKILIYLFVLSINGFIVNTNYGKILFIGVYLAFVFEIIVSLPRLKILLNNGIKGRFMLFLILLSITVVSRLIFEPFSSKLFHPINIPAWTVPFAVLLTYNLSLDRFFSLLSRNFNFLMVLIATPWFFGINIFDSMLFFFLPLMLPRSGIVWSQKTVLLVLFLLSAYIKDSRGTLVLIFVSILFIFYSTIPRKKLLFKILHIKSIIVVFLFGLIAVQIWTIIPSAVTHKLLVDSRTWLYIDLANSLDMSSVLVGKGVTGVYYGWSDTDKQMIFREAFEGFYGHVVLKAGLIYLLSYLTVYISVWVDNSDKRLGLLMFATFFNMLTYGIPNFSPTFLGMWLLMGFTMKIKRSAV